MIRTVKSGLEDNTADQAWRSALRAEMLARRQAMSPELHADHCARLVQHLVAVLPVPSGAIIGFCWPIRQEPDIRPAIAHWRQAGCRAALAVVTASASPLAFRDWQPDTPLIADRYGIPTPQTGDWLQPDLLMLPLNAFDAAGYRLGYGGGYFDRTLATITPRPIAVGIGFELNRVASIRPHAHDQRLDWIVTEAGATPLQEA